MLNEWQGIGNLGADPEIRSFSNGGRVANMRLAVTKKYKDRDGNRQERTEWISLAVFSDGLVGVIEQYVRKGSKLFIRGELRTRKYQAQDGSDRYATEVVLQGPGSVLQMLDSPGGASSNQQGGGDISPKGGSWADDLDDDIGF